MDYPHLPAQLGPNQRVHTFRNYPVLIAPWPKVSLKHPDMLDFKALAGPINGSFMPIIHQGRYKVGGGRQGAPIEGGEQASYK